MIKTFNQLLSHSDLGKLILRVSFAGMMLFHGIFKLQHGIGGIEGMVTSHGLPAFFAYGVYVGEFIAPVLIILGIFTRFSALVILINMIVAIYLTNSSIFALNASTGGWAIEGIAVFIFSSLAIALLGSGKYAVARD